MIDLIVFDVDGTLAKIYTQRLLPGVAEFFQLVFSGNCPAAPRVAIATNQGGVGLRHWMERENFGRPAKFPTVESIEERLRGLVAALGGDPNLPIYVSYRYQNKEGEWSPVPPGEENNLRWQQNWRKPLPGMLLQAMQDAGVPPERTLFVGDSEDDQNAALAAGCAFEWAQTFFARSWQSCETLAEYTPSAPAEKLDRG